MAGADRVHFEELLALAGGTGRWQVLLVGWMSLFFFTAGYNNISMIFLGATADHLCADGQSANVTFESLSETGAERCLAPDGQPCRRWTYDPAFSGSSVVTQWDLVCAHLPLLSTAQSVLQLGALAGSLSAGVLGDRFGRRIVHLCMLVVYVTAGFLSTAPGPYWLFVLSRFVLGLGMMGVVSSNHVIVSEITGVHWRAWANQLMVVPIALGEALAAAFAYQLRVWWQLQLALAVPALVFVFSYWLVPESPRWLILRGRDEEALAVLATAARVNGRPLSEQKRMKEMMLDIRRGEVAEEAKTSSAKTSNVLENAFSSDMSGLCRSPRLRRWMMPTCLCWAALCGAYYGLSFDVAQLSSSPYLAGALSGLVGVPGYFVSPLLNRIGRRPVACATFCLAGVCMLLVLTSDDPRLWLAAGLFGKLFIASGCIMMYVHTPEYIPTSIRTVGFSIAVVSSRLGAFAAPYVVDLARQFHRAAPSVVFGCGCLLASLAVLLLPETAGRHLPETVAELDAGALDQPEEGTGSGAQRCGKDRKKPEKMESYGSYKISDGVW